MDYQRSDYSDLSCQMCNRDRKTDVVIKLCYRCYRYYQRPYTLHEELSCIITGTRLTEDDDWTEDDDVDNWQEKDAFAIFEEDGCEEYVDRRRPTVYFRDGHSDKGFSISRSIVTPYKLTGVHILVRLLQEYPKLHSEFIRLALCGLYYNFPPREYREERMSEDIWRYILEFHGCE